MWSYGMLLGAQPLTESCLAQMQVLRPRNLGTAQFSRPPLVGSEENRPKLLESCMKRLWSRNSVYSTQCKRREVFSRLARHRSVSRPAYPWRQCPIEKGRPHFWQIPSRLRQTPALARPNRQRVGAGSHFEAQNRFGASPQARKRSIKTGCLCLCSPEQSNTMPH